MFLDGLPPDYVAHGSGVETIDEEDSKEAEETTDLRDCPQRQPSSSSGNSDVPLDYPVDELVG